MDKAEKIAAARRKLKDFQTHKQEPKEESAVHDVTPQPQKTVDISADSARDFFVQSQQQQPQISSFFDNVSSNNFVLQPFPDNQQIQPTPHFIASPPFQQFTAQPAFPAYTDPQPQPPYQQQAQPHEVNMRPREYFVPASHETDAVIPSQVLPEQPSQSNSQLTIQPNFFNMEAKHLQQEPIVVNNDASRLHQQIEQQSLEIVQLKSELEFHRTTAMNLQKNADDLSRLRQESLSHVDVVKVLVSEKSHLMDSLHKSEMMVKSKMEENEELQNRLVASRHRVKSLESEVKTTFGKPAMDFEAESKRIEETVAERIKEFKDSNARIEAERDEIKVLLNQKRIELENLQKNFDHLNTELHLASVKISQLSDGTTLPDTNQNQISALSQELAIKQQQITELYSIIDQVNRDKEGSDNQYQNYVSHLTREMEALKVNAMELSSENDSLVKREHELLKHTGDLERQIQQQMQKQKTYAENQKDQTPITSAEEIQKFSSQIIALNESNESLKSQLAKTEAERDSVVQNLLLREEELKDMELRMDRLKTETPNLSQLMTDFEDKSVAASRALSQNQGLKEQLDEMQRAFITMTNDKMELTDKLQSEMHLCKEMKIRHDAMEVDLNEMKDKWQFKENEMIRLSHENTVLEKKILQQNIEIDRLRHYESKEYHGTEGILENELDNCKRLIETLTNKINILESHQHSGNEHEHSHEGHGHSHSHDNNHNHNEHDHRHESEHKSQDHNCQDDESKKQLLAEIEMLKMEKNELLKAMTDFQLSKKAVNAEASENVTNGNSEVTEMTQKLQVPKSVTPSMATEEALEKLQARFRRTMLEVAELQEEKQRLEHVVTQLQFETETIGEYITLYQYQRRLLKQKEHERDIQLKNLSADREKMNEKLVQLNGLIGKFVLQHSDSVELAKEASKLLDQKESEPLIIHSETPSTANMQKLKEETAGKILEILSDIKTANSISYDTNVGVEHCSCCLGKLETV